MILYNQRDLQQTLSTKYRMSQIVFVSKYHILSNINMDCEDTTSIYDPEIPATPMYIFGAFLFVLAIDVIGYGVLVPVFGIYISGIFTNVPWYPLNTKYELLLNVFFTYGFVHCTIWLCGEDRYWKHLFAFESLHYKLLRFRDGVNAIIFILSLVNLGSTIEIMTRGGSMKPQYLTEGAGYFFIKTLFGWRPIEEANLSQFAPPDLGFGENGEYEHGIMYMFYWAVLAACAAKLVYFNTLFTYMRAMNLFIDMKPSFEDEVKACNPFQRLSSIKMMD